ncbi:MAG TPA: AAA family ATPase [Methanoregulaceae archaeon]|nr:AAA family ATPase [Methanoregulaceae archaeon]
MKPFTVAVSGKGGTGKTTVCALLIRSLIEAGQTPVLAVDADPNANLHEALGIVLKDTLGGMREDAFTRNIPPGMSRIEYIKYRFMQVIQEETGFDLLSMGRPEGSGCYCFANDLLQSCIQALERDYKFIIIDSEAGMEHISRGTIGIPDLLLIVSDPGARGVRTAARIRDLAVSLGLGPVHTGLVFNRYKGESAADISGLPEPMAWIPEDPAIENADLAGKPIIGIDPSSPALGIVRNLAEILMMRSMQVK